MTRRPRASATLLSSVAAVVPARLVKKLDQNPRAADAWAWIGEEGAVLVRTDGGETVTLRPDGEVVTRADQVACSCLLSPRCFHLLAVVACLDVAEPEAANGIERDGGAQESSDAQRLMPAAAAEANDRVALTDAQRAAGDLAWHAAARVVTGGASAAGVVVQGELLRAVHAARAAGLHRLAAAGTRVVREVRTLREEKPGFSLAELVLDLEELLLAARTTRQAADVGAAWLGVARRAYDDVGGLRLTGLFTEPIVGAAYAGVVTYLCDDDGRVWTAHDVMPGEPSRARSAYDAAARMGDTSVPHRRLAREGLFLQGATGSRDMRLGAGAGVRAVRSSETSIEESAAASLWRPPLEAQIERAYAALDVPFGDRSAASTLLFLQGSVVGHDGAALVLAADRAGGAPLTVRIVAKADHAELSYRDNLRMLASAPGLRLRVAGHIVHDRPRTLTAVAVMPLAPEAHGPSLTLPPEWGARVCVGLDRLQATHLAATARDREVALRSPADPDPLAALRRRIHRLVLGGRGTVRPAAAGDIEAERAALDKRLMPVAATMLAGMARAALEKGDVAEMWLGAAVYERTATRALQRAAWI